MFKQFTASGWSSICSAQHQEVWEIFTLLSIVLPHLSPSGNWCYIHVHNKRKERQVKDPQTNKIHHKLHYIQKSFETCYTKFYSQPQTAESADLKFLLTSLDLPTMGTEESKILTQKVAEEEISKAISRLKTNTISGDDGYLAEWCKIF